MRHRVIPLRALGWDLPDDPEDLPPLVLPPSPLDEMRQLATALQARDASAVDSTLERGRRQLQRMVIDELHRLVGALITDVATAQTVRDKVGRGLGSGANFLAARPPDGVLAECADAAAVVDRFDAACQALLTFLSAEVRRAITAAGGVPPEDTVTWVLDAVAALTDAMERSDADGLDRKAKLAVWLVRGLDLPEHQGFPIPG